MKVKMTGILLKMTCCAGSGGGGLSFICRNIVTPMINGQAPRWRNEPTIGRVVGSEATEPNRLNTLVGSGPDRSLIQPKNGACRISMVTNKTLYSEKNTGICNATGRQPAIGLIFSFL